MSGAPRFARSGRWRFFVSGGVIILLLTMLIIFHNQQELDEKRELRLRSLNDQLQSILEQKYDLERNNENERIKQGDVRRDLEQKLNELRELQSKDQLRYEKLLQTHKVLQNKQNELTLEYDKSKKEHKDYVNDMERQLQEMRAKLENEQTVDDNEIIAWKKKYDSLMTAKEQIEASLVAANAKSQRIVELENLINDYKERCDYKPERNSDAHMLQLNKPLHPPDTHQSHRDTNATTAAAHNHSDGYHQQQLQPHQAKSFSKQELVSAGVYKIDVKITNLTQTQSAIDLLPINNTNNTSHMRNNVTDVVLAQLPSILPRQNALSGGGLILNSVENFQMVQKLSGDLDSNNRQQNVAVSPLSAPRKPTSTDGTKAEKQVLGPVPAALEMGQKSTNSSPSTGGSSSLSPLPLPPNQQRKLPENVAPIPEDFNELLKNDVAASQKSTRKTTKIEKLDTADAGGDTNNAAEVIKNDNDDKNNRYANAVNDLDDGHVRNKVKKDANEDSGAHEIKDHDMNGENFNLPAEDGNFFAGDNDGAGGGGGGGEKLVNVGPAAVDEDRDDGIDQHRKDDDDDMLGVGGADTGDIAVKNRNQLLDAAENLNNEVAGDQGKEFPVDELHLEDGNDEDGDDDFSNIVAREQGGQAIRN